MTDETGSTVPRRQLGRMLRALRDESCVTLDGAAATLACTRQKVWRIERGLGAVRTPVVKALCELLDASPELTAALTALATETKARRLLRITDRGALSRPARRIGRL
jgi:transcriptional regulator with XRE-family HTH domain